MTDKAPVVIDNGTGYDPEYPSDMAVYFLV